MNTCKLLVTLLICYPMLLMYLIHKKNLQYPVISSLLIKILHCLKSSDSTEVKQMEQIWRVYSSNPRGACLFLDLQLFSLFKTISTLQNIIIMLQIQSNKYKVTNILPVKNCVGHLLGFEPMPSCLLSYTQNTELQIQLIISLLCVKVGEL